jgi:hypothetical protein
VVTQTRRMPPREVTQRAAIVSAEGIGSDAGVWVELKTVDPQTGTRIDRGFFSPAAVVSLPGRPASEKRMGLQRVQRLHPDGKLYEYPPGSSVALRGDEEVRTLGLFEVSNTQPPRVDTLGVDTLRIGSKSFPSTIVRKRWVGSDEWRASTDTTRVNRVLLTLTQDVCPEVPLTGFTHSLLLVRTAQFAATDTLGENPIPPPDPDAVPVLYRVELTLGDIGTGAVPEVTQEPEPAPADSGPGADLPPR